MGKQRAGFWPETRVVDKKCHARVVVHQTAGFGGNINNMVCLSLDMPTLSWPHSNVCVCVPGRV